MNIPWHNRIGRPAASSGPAGTTGKHFSFCSCRDDGVTAAPGEESVGSAAAHFWVSDDNVNRPFFPGSFKANKGMYLFMYNHDIVLCSFM